MLAPRALLKGSTMSFIETCLSFAIVSSVVLIAVPSLLKTRDEYVLNSATRDVATRMHAARLRAISRNIDCRFRVTSSATYLIECEDPVWRTMAAATVPRGIGIAANAKPEFHRLGNVAPTGTVTLTNASGRQKKVVVNTGGRI